NGVSFDLESTKQQLATAGLQIQLQNSDVIENIIGSAQDDTLFGNELNNNIQGGQGSDHIDGRGGGHDVLDGGLGFDDPEILDNSQSGFTKTGASWTNTSGSGFNDSYF